MHGEGRAVVEDRKVIDLGTCPVVVDGTDPARLEETTQQAALWAVNAAQEALSVQTNNGKLSYCNMRDAIALRATPDWDCRTACEEYERCVADGGNPFLFDQAAG